MEQIEKDIQPEDFKERSIWRELVKLCWPEEALIHSRLYGRNRLYNSQSRYDHGSGEEEV